jgi:hypothetical protein
MYQNTDPELRQKYKKVTPIFLSNKLSSTLIIPIELARRHGLDKPSNVILEDTDEGILIKKIRIIEDEV